MEGFWPIFFLLVVLKIPVFGALWLVWWASQAPEQETTGEDSDGGFKRHRPFPTRPRGPHHSPSGAGAMGRRRATQTQRRPSARAPRQPDRVP
ncbi:MAG TPA: hypothetical protein VF093_08220 [Solirubrobacterales bacterium]